MRDRASDLRAIADGRLMLNVRNGVTVARSMLARIADEFEAMSTALNAAIERAEKAEGLIDRLRREAEQHAQEARTANATIAEIYQAVTDATGEPGNWNGAEPVRARLTALRARVAELKKEIARTRGAFYVEYDEDGSVAAVTHDSGALRTIVSRLDAALKEKNDEQG